MRKRFFELLGDYWWVLLLLIFAGYLLTDLPIFTLILFPIGLLFVLFIFFPFFFQLFAPSFFLIASLKEHFKDTESMPWGKKYVFIPMALLGSVLFVTAQSILTIWVFILAFVIWSSIISPLLTFFLVFIFGLAPLAIITAPFAVWVVDGLGAFLATVIFFLLALFWIGFSKLVASEDYSTTPEDLLGYSPQLYMLGALSLQIIALPFYHIGLPLENSIMLNIGDWVAGWGGAVFILLTLVAWVKWLGVKKKMPKEEREELYRPSVWVYIFGFLITSVLYSAFTTMYFAPVFALYWLNIIFFIAIIARLFVFIKRLFKRKQVEPSKQLEQQKNE